jgi:hypothetical protein
VIRIDIHSTWENLTNMIHTLFTSVHVCPTYASCGRSPYVAIFYVVVNRFEKIHCPWEECPPTQSTTRRLTDPWVRTQLLSHNSQWSSGEKLSFCWQSTTRITGPISPACDRYGQYLLAGVNPSVLNRLRWGLQPWRCQLFTYHSPTFPIGGLQFLPKGPARSAV